MNDTVRLLVMENARMRLQVSMTAPREAAERQAQTEAGILCEVLFRLACAPQEGELYNAYDGINHVYKHIDVTAAELGVIDAAARALRAEQSRKPRNIGELRVWDVLLDAIDGAWCRMAKAAVDSDSPLLRHLARELAAVRNEEASS